VTHPLKLTDGNPRMSITTEATDVPDSDSPGTGVG
jgi:hypothetical protein